MKKSKGVFIFGGLLFTICLLLILIQEPVGLTASNKCGDVLNALVVTVGRKNIHPTLIAILEKHTNKSVCSANVIGEVEASNLKNDFNQLVAICNKHYSALPVTEVVIVEPTPDKPVVARDTDFAKAADSGHKDDNVDVSRSAKAEEVALIAIDVPGTAGAFTDKQTADSVNPDVRTDRVGLADNGALNQDDRQCCNLGDT